MYPDNCWKERKRNGWRATIHAALGAFSREFSREYNEGGNDCAASGLVRGIAIELIFVDAVAQGVARHTE